MAAHFQSGVDEMIRQAELEDLRKDLGAMKRELRAPVEMDPRTTTTPPPDKMVALNRLAAYLQDQRQYDEAETLLEQCLSMAERLQGPDSEMT
ncbi:MAG TPA: tetratricopeptide repeat protein, partial [Bacteroidia bacterium]|nr:tetratricopeptide repeat protein [Bacteroidia bacterium]